MLKTYGFRLACIATLATGVCAGVRARNTLKVCGSAKRGLWDTAISDIGPGAPVFSRSKA